MKKILGVLFVLGLASASALAVTILPANVKLEVVSTQGIGQISVFNKTTNEPVVLTCTGTTPCTHTFRSGTKVAISGNSQSAAFVFTGWGPNTGSAVACGTQSGATCFFTITEDSKATAKIVQSFIVRVQVGTGSGSIRVKDHGVTQFDCVSTAPSSCSTGFLTGSAITIENTARSGQQFSGYTNKTGSMLACTTNPCSFRLAADSSMVSNFIQIP